MKMRMLRCWMRVSQWAIQDGIGQRSLDRLLLITRVADTLQLTFHNTRGMHNIISSIPSCAQCSTSYLSFPDNPEEKHMVQYRKPLEAICTLLGNPAHANDIVYKPCKMWTGKWWNAVLELLPVGAAVSPVIIATDKMQLTQFSGSKSAYPVYLTLGNIPRAVRHKPSQQACILIGYLSIEKILGSKLTKKDKSLWVQCLFHDSMRTVLEPLKEVGMTGMEVTGGDGKVRMVYPILACYIVDYPEQCLVTCSNISGTIQHPFWEGFPYANIHLSITPDILHQLYQGIFKHALSQVSGRESKDMAYILLCYLIGKVPRWVLLAFRSLLNFIYLTQYPSHDDQTLRYLQDALETFHKHKDILIQLHMCSHFDILKVHSLVHYINSICQFGATNNYNMEAFERLHIDLAKDVWRSTNKREECPQMRISAFQLYLDRVDHPPTIPASIPQPPNILITKLPSRVAQSLQNIIDTHHCPGPISD
ncbi:hypothetical protein K503DRAFT_794902 [Rhizopogon vinicolor AM-OR11-026]|uniref:Uncharacterized protein n=1 Tax=Rhizopogon vinicolor AM-OR11-026 TaxID=1314800 RepID=A0A1B7MGN4_9AGAM|nr:hypothetical protein K503DRAFT_794902 [Rhizopogon vinicolor AM-OR11-026]